MRARTLAGVAVLTTLVLAFSVVPSGVQAQTNVNYKLRCHGSATFTATATWVWTSDGQPIAGSGGTATCVDSGTVTGTDIMPADANDIRVSLTIDDTADGQAPKTKTDAKVFDPAKPFHMLVKLSLKDPAFSMLRLAEA